MCISECRFTNHAVRPKTHAIYTTLMGILRLSPTIIGLQRYCFSYSYPSQMPANTQSLQLFNNI